MNLLYMKYALEIASCGSINKAAKKLYIDQPNLSRCMKDLEATLGIAIFERSPKGMKLTPDGKRFISYAKAILDQVDAVESMFGQNPTKQKRFSVSVPRTSYIAEAFAAFSRSITEESAAEIWYKETDTPHTVKNVTEEDYKLGIIRYASCYDGYYTDLLDEKGLVYETVSEFRHVLIASAASSLANKSDADFADLAGKIEITHRDRYEPCLPFSEKEKTKIPDTGRRIFVFERASQFELLAENPETFMWVSPVPLKLLSKYGLIQCTCTENTEIYKDVMIYRKGYRLSELDKAFIFELCRVKRETFGGKI